MDFDGRGLTNAHPDYRRSKVYYSFYSFLATIVSYSSYLLISLMLRFGPNDDRYPYSTNAPRFGNENRPFLHNDYLISQLYACIIIMMSLGFLFAYNKYLKHFYPQMHECYRNLLYICTQRPHKLTFIFTITVMNMAIVVSAFLAENRVWYADVEEDDAKCG